MVLTIMLDVEAELNLVGYVGADLTAEECVLADNFGDGIIACEFELKAGGENFGILFKGGFHPIYYTLKWVNNASPSWTDPFSWL